MGCISLFDVCSCNSAVRQQRALQPSSLVEASSYGLTARKMGALNGEEKEAITEQCIQLETRPVH